MSSSDNDKNGMASTVAPRVSQIASALTSSLPGTSSKTQDPESIPWDPNCTRFPSRKDVPKIPGAPDGAAWVWGKDDFVGRLNLLTPQRVKAAVAEVQTGEVVGLDLPLNVPEQPAFHREPFEHRIKTVVENVVFDDNYNLNTQSGTQWDGFRHFAHLESQTFYNGTKASDIQGPDANQKCSIHHWSAHGIAGRGILLDYRHYAQSHNIPYDPYKRHAITYSALQHCGHAQGIDIRPESQGGDIKVGDILLIRSGFVERYAELSPEERKAAALRQDDDLQWTGVKQEEPLLDWLHDCYFAAVAGDSPTFEAWPPVEGWYIHQNILAFWGMPLGEMWDLEKLALKCRERKKWTFFVTSAPANMPGGVSSHANATAIL